MYRATRWGAIIIKFCGDVCSNWRSALKTPSVRLSIVRSAIAHRCWKKRWRRKLDWAGSVKHSNLLNRHAGSWFFLGELYVGLELPVDQPTGNHCGSCQACLDICPTQAIIAPYQVDARRCISYHTIELYGPIPLAFRRAMGNRIYGCDDCQLVCPWNKFSQPTAEVDFLPRHGLDAPQLIDLFQWG